MRMIGAFLTACVVLAAAQAIAALLIVLLFVGFVYSLFVAPRETLGFVGILLVAGMWQSQPILFIVLICLLLVARHMKSR